MLLRAILMVLLVTYSLPFQARSQDDIDVLSDKTLIQNLQNPKPVVRAKAFGDLLLFGPNERRVKGLLEICTNSTNYKNRALAVHTLTTWRSPEGLRPVIQLLKVSDDNLVFACCLGLGLYNDPRTIDPLIQVFKNTKSPNIKLESIRSLGRNADPRAQVFLKAQLKNDDPQIQAAAAGALSFSGNNSGHDLAVSFLKLKDHKNSILGDSLIAVGENKDPADLPLLDSLNQDPSLTLGQKTEIKIAQYKIQSKTMTEAEQLRDLRNFLYGSETEINATLLQKGFAARELAVMATPASIKMLQDASKDPYLGFYRDKLVNYLRVYDHL